MFKAVLVFLLIAGVATGCAMQREQLIAENPQWPPELVTMINQGQIKRGMGKDMVLAAWGNPCHVMNNSWDSMWTYEGDFAGDEYLCDGTSVFFDNDGFVSGWSGAQ